MPDPEIPTSIEEGQIDPKLAEKLEKSIKSREQAPTMAEQSPDAETWKRFRDTLGQPFDSERVTLAQLRQIRKDPMVAFGLHYRKVPLTQADWHINARDKDGPNAQVAAFLDAALRPIMARLILQRTLAFDFGFCGIVKRFKQANPGGVYTDPREENEENRVKPIWDEGSILPIIPKVPVVLKAERVTPVFDDRTGEFNGMEYETPPGQTNRSSGFRASRKNETIKEIDVFHSYWGTHNKDDEEGSIFGYPLIAHARDYWWAYRFLFMMSNRAYERVAIPPLLAYHPPGNTVIDETDGTTQPNWEIALEMGERLRSNAIGAVPSQMAQTGLDTTSNTQREWDFKFLETASDSLKQFDERFNYLNVMKLRSVMVPEQALIEGEGGTSSRNVAAQMAEIFIGSQDLTMKIIDDEINRYWIPQLLITNFPEFINNGGQATKESHGFRSQDMEMYRQIIQLLGQGDPTLMARIDIGEIFRRVGMPVRDAADFERERTAVVAAAAAANPPAVTPTAGSVGVVPLNPGQQNGGSLPEPASAVAGFSDDEPQMVYIQPPDHINLSELDDFIASIPGSKHYEDKTIRALMIKLRAQWAAHFRRMYPDLANHIATTEIKLADEDDEELSTAQKAGIAAGAAYITKRQAEQLAKKMLKSWEVSTKVLEKLATASAKVIKQMLKRGVSLEFKRSGMKGVVEDDAYNDFLENQIGRLIKLSHETVEDEMRSFLVNQIRDGNDAKTIADNITQHFTDFPRTKAERIARSEVRDAMNAATLLASEGAGVRYVRATDGTDFDQECRERNGKLFTVKEGWKEMRKEHPYGTLGFDPIPRADFAIKWVNEMPERAPEDSAGWFDNEHSTIYVFQDDEEAEQYIEAIGAWLIDNNDEGYVVRNGR